MRWLPLCLCAFLTGLSCSEAHALPAIGERLPISRLIAKLEARKSAHPDDPEVYYAVGRDYYLAAVNNAGRFEVFEDGKQGFDVGIPRMITRNAKGFADWTEPEESIEPPALPPPAAVKPPLGRFIYCATHAVKNFEEAIARSPRNSVYSLSYACMLEEIWTRAFGQHPTRFPPEFQKVRVPSVRDAYARALALAKQPRANAAAGSAPGPLADFDDYLREAVSVEAAKALIRLEPATKLSAGEDLVLQDARAIIAEFQRKPQKVHPVTPIVFTFNPNVARLQELLAPETIVQFDLRGFGRQQDWPWVKPELGFLVWDPAATGRIVSARQLFGGYTFQLFWKDGYDALSVLDDNDDGQLAGTELAGVSAWFDRNQDGISESGEVTPVQKLRIISIATERSGYDEVHPTAVRGITLRDGTSVRTWDWMVSPATLGYRHPHRSQPTQTTIQGSGARSPTLPRG